MKKTIMFLASVPVYIFGLAQNVGVGTTTPTEKLDVNGNINITGQVKVNGNAGSANQALMKDAANNLVWGDLSEFKNISVTDCPNLATTAGSNNCSSTFFIPPGVTTILVECWGGGGGGANFTGGGGGGYVSARLTVTPGASASLTLGAGGNFGSAGVDGIPGGNTIFSIGGATLTAFGGAGGSKLDVSTSTSSTVGQTLGGIYAATGIASYYIGFNGSPGGISKLSYIQVSATEFGKKIEYGDGGDAALLPGSGAKGGYRISSASLTHQILATQSAIQPGGGGGADATWGFYGRGGRIIIRW